MNQTELLNIFLSQSADVLWIVDKKFHLIYANQSYLNFMERITGVKIKLNDSSFVGFYDETFTDKWKALYNKAFQGISFEIEEQYFDPKLKEARFNQVTFEPLKNEEGEIFAVSCKSKDVTNIIAQRNLANEMMGASLDVFCTVNELGFFVYVSAASLNHWGYLPEELIGKSFKDLLIEEDASETFEVIDGLRKGKDVKSFINRYRKKDGGIAYNLWSARWDEVTKQRYAVAKDFGDKIEQEEKIKLSEKRFKALVQEGSDLIVILDEKGNYLYVSTSSNSILSDLPEGIAGKSAFDFIHPDDIERTKASLQKILKGEKLTIEPYRFLNNKNEWRWLETVVTNMLDNPAVKGLVANSRDITDKIEEKHKLKLLESVITNTTDAVIITEAAFFDEPNPKIIYVNEAFTEMTGYEAHEVIGKNPRMFQGPKSDRDELAKLGSAIRKWQPYEITTINYKKDGEEFWINFTVTPVANEEGIYTHYVAVQRNVNEKKYKELEKELLAQISIGFNTENNFVSAANELCKSISKFGNFDWVEIWTSNLEKSEMKLLSNCMPNPDDGLFYKESKHLNSFKITESLVGQVWSLNEELIWEDIENNKNFIRRGAAKKIGIKAVMGIPLIFNGQVIAVLKIGSKHNSENFKNYLPIFRRLKSFIGSELNRKRLEGDLNHLFDAIPDILSLADFKGKILKINKAGCELLGYKEEEILYHNFDEFVHPDDKYISYNELKRLKNGETNFEFENRYLTKTGQVIWLNWYCNSAREEGVIYATAKNITEEKKLRELNRQAGSLAKIGSWELDLSTQNVFWSNEVHQMHETNPKHFQPNLQTAINFYREDFQDLVKSEFIKVTEAQQSFDFEAILVTAKKKEIWVRAMGKSEFLGDKCIRIFGSFQDIHIPKMLEIRISEILASISDAFYAVDKNWNITYFNKEAERLLLVSEKEAIGRNIWELFPYAVGTDLDKIYHSITKNLKPKTFEYFYPANNKWYEVSAYPSVGGLSVYFKNIDERKEAASKLQQANERFEKVTEATNDAIWDWDMVNKKFYRSNAIERFFGEGALKLLEEKDFWTDKFHPDDLLKIMDSITEAVANPLATRWECEYRINNGDGKIVFVIDRGIIIRNEEGKAIRMVGAMTDITEQKFMTLQLSELNQSLQKYTLELERSNEELEQFAFVASHDLQEPLRMISSFLDQLKRKYGDQLDQKAHQYIYFATDGAKRMKQIILDLLKYSRTSTSAEAIEEVDVNEVLLEFSQLRRKIISEKNAEIEAMKLPVLYSYKAAVTQIFHCLLDNALKYTAEGKPPVINIGVIENEEEWLFSIKDNGIGIDAQFYDKIFTIFQRLHNRDQYTGTGIGLSIAKRHVEFLGGKIWLESEVGLGSIFYFSIPKNKKNE